MLARADLGALLAIALSAAAAGASLVQGDAARVPVSVTLLGIALFSLRVPYAGLLAVLPAAFIIQPAPVVLSWRELAFAGLLVASATAAAVHALRASRPLLLRCARLSSLPLVFLAVNACTAHYHGVTAREWLRGAVPFLFGLYAIPVALELEREPERATAWRWALAALAALFAFNVVFVFVRDECWKPSTYALIDGGWLRMSRAEAALKHAEVFEFELFRVTVLTPRSTDVLVPLAAVWGGWAALWAAMPAARACGLVLAACGFGAVVLTVTRSMLVATLLGLGLVLGFGLVRRRLGACAVLAVTLTLSGGAAYWGGGVNRTFAVRNAQSARAIAEGTTALLAPRVPEPAPSVHTAAVPAPGNSPVPVAVRVPGNRRAAPPPPTRPPDGSVGVRVQEARIAWQLFRSAPLLGHGLGVQHEIYFSGDQPSRVGFIHNWPLYALMVSGLTGFALYSWWLLGPAWIAVRGLGASEDVWLVLPTLGVMALYGTMFAVFRLIPFNLVLGCLWALVYTAAARR